MQYLLLNRFEAFFRIAILGAVKNPGNYFINEDDNILDLIALAGGSLEGADLSKVFIIGNEKKSEIDIEKLLNGNSDQLQTRLDWAEQVYIPKTDNYSMNNLLIITSGISLLLSISILLLN